MHGTGKEWARLLDSMTGTGAFTIQGGAWTSVDLGQSLASSLRGALKGIGVGGSGGRGGSGEPHPTVLKALEGSFAVRGRALHFDRPLKIQSSFGDASLTGTVRFDERIDLNGAVQLNPEFVSQVVSLRPQHPITAPLSVKGTLSSPQVHVSESDVAKGLMEALPPGGPIRKGLRGLFGGG